MLLSGIIVARDRDVVVLSLQPDIGGEGIGLFIVDLQGQVAERVSLIRQVLNFQIGGE